MGLNLSLMLIVGLFGASLSLNLSSVALMSGRALSQQVAQRKLKSLVLGFLFGVVVASFLLFSTVVLIASKLLSTTTNGQNFNVIQTVWFYLLIGLVLQFLIMLFCVVRQLPNVTVNPWASDAVRSFLRKRSIKTDSAVEAISLGIMNVLANSWLLVLPLTILALILLANLKLLDLGLFSLMIGLPILIFYICLSLKIKISQIHLFLINNAYFLRLVSFLTLLILGLLVFYARIIGGV